MVQPDLHLLGKRNTAMNVKRVCLHEYIVSGIKTVPLYFWF